MDFRFNRASRQPPGSPDGRVPESIPLLFGRGTLSAGWRKLHAAGCRLWPEGAGNRMPRRFPFMKVPLYKDVQSAQKRIAPHVHVTPVLTSVALDSLAGASLFFKCENFQKTGAFKARGATNAVFGLEGEVAKRGVATHSSGNHGQALAFAASRRGIPCHVVMPATANEAKKSAVRGYGGFITECAPSMSSRELASSRVRDATGAHFVHPYDDPAVIAGQATCAKEFIGQVGELEAIIAPIGGGGLISGTCLTVASLSPRLSVYAAEPGNADDAARSFRAGRIIADDAPDTIADGLRASLKELTWHFVSRHVADVLTVTEDEIIAATKLVWQRMKIVIEPSSAVPLAAILKNQVCFSGKRVGVILTGGNVDLERLPWLRSEQEVRP